VAHNEDIVNPPSERLAEQFVVVVEEGSAHGRSVVVTVEAPMGGAFR